jgi:hypothetical protein
MLVRIKPTQFFIDNSNLSLRNLSLQSAPLFRQAFFRSYKIRVPFNFLFLFLFLFLIMLLCQIIYISRALKRSAQKNKNKECAGLKKKNE